jgi:tRNA threonylcarbamoyladenosine biosynthesis protein TsaB
MILLALDTATTVCGASLSRDGSVIGELMLNRGGTHTRAVMDAVRALLSVSGLQIGDIDLFAVTRGPGSFTGLRIGISTVKGLAVAARKPVVGISTLEVLAHQAPVGTPLVCPVLDARRKEVYWSLYRSEGGRLVPKRSEQAGSPGDIAPFIDDDCTFIGNGVQPYAGSIQAGLDRPMVLAGMGNDVVRPAVLARLGWMRYIDDDLDDAAAFAPTYLRKSDAELNFGQNKPMDTTAA